MPDLYRKQRAEEFVKFVYTLDTNDKIDFMRAMTQIVQEDEGVCKRCCGWGKIETWHSDNPRGPVESNCPGCRGTGKKPWGEDAEEDTWGGRDVM